MLSDVIIYDNSKKFVSVDAEAVVYVDVSSDLPLECLSCDFP